MEEAIVNLLTTMMQPCVMMDKTTVNDGMGGFTPTWVRGATFDAFVRKETAPELVVAEKQGVKETFTVVVPIGTPLEYHDVFMRLSDNAVFRLTSNVQDDAAPGASTVKIAKANCERWELT